MISAGVVLSVCASENSGPEAQLVQLLWKSSLMQEEHKKEDMDGIRIKCSGFPTQYDPRSTAPVCQDSDAPSSTPRCCCWGAACCWCSARWSWRATSTPTPTGSGSGRWCCWADSCLSPALTMSTLHTKPSQETQTGALTSSQMSSPFNLSRCAVVKFHIYLKFYFKSTAILDMVRKTSHLYH